MASFFACFRVKVTPFAEENLHSDLPLPVNLGRMRVSQNTQNGNDEPLNEDETSSWLPETSPITRTESLELLQANVEPTESSIEEQKMAEKLGVDLKSCGMSLEQVLRVLVEEELTSEGMFTEKMDILKGLGEDKIGGE